MSFVVAGGGVVIGVAVPWLICKLNHLLLKRTGEEPAIQILASLLIPFAVYPAGCGVTAAPWMG
ncbi:hypothetical protein [Sorangium cellulosum]|uniref:Uncharacterized protein n=1 Tax=Sorangium cellulosum TaxID=56 RepID=A0A150R291_SORCE|nr:hypothetical protein [Sorangium cellulosum]KYF74324.1 hypothetical protein BE15_33610 [Sorangium cellulosum]